ncbi:MAG: ribonuclease J [Bdellovibrionales bacterium]|nr:ribonuclease J [Bdellovibrionales bacterium]
MSDSVASSLAALDSLPVESGTLRILPLGGLGEIGMNCLIIESPEEIIVLDCGVMFSDLDHFGIEYVIPDFSYLQARADKVKAVILTHGHEDHIGSVPYLLKHGIRAPLYASTFTSLMLREKLTEFGLLQAAEIRTFKMGETFRTKDFAIRTTSVNHSIVDAAALIIDTPLGKIVHTGDFKIDPTPFFGQRLDENVFKQAGEDGVLLLLSDSTNVERHSHSHSDAEVYHSFDHLFAAAEGLTFVAMFSSNVARMAQVFDLAHKQGKKIALCGRSMEKNFELAVEAGYIKDSAGQLITLDDVEAHDRKDVLILTTGTQGEYRSALFRIAAGEHSLLDLREGDRVLMSSRQIPGNEKNVGRMINNLFKQGAEVLYEATHKIHVSGHATRPELKQMIEWTKPRFFLPIHGEYRHLVHHAKVAEETGMNEDRILVATNGDVLSIGKDHFEIVHEMEEEPRTFIDGAVMNEITKEILKDRRKLAETGGVFVLMTRDPDTGNVVAGPEVITRGIATPELEATVIEKSRELALRLVRESKRYMDKHGAADPDLAETIRVEVRRMVHSIVGKKPVVIPFILDL